MLGKRDIRVRGSVGQRKQVPQDGLVAGTAQGELRSLLFLCHEIFGNIFNSSFPFQNMESVQKTLSTQ